MNGTIEIVLPLPPTGRQFCTPCSNEYRLVFDKAWDIENVMKSLKNGEHRVLDGFPPGTELPELPRIGVTYGIYAPWQPALGLVPVLVCWTHFASLTFSQMAVAPGMTPDQLAALMKKGPGGLLTG